MNNYNNKLSRTILINAINMQLINEVFDCVLAADIAFYQYTEFWSISGN